MTQAEALTEHVKALREDLRETAALCEILKEALLRMALAGQRVEERLDRLESQQLILPDS